MNPGYTTLQCSINSYINTQLQKGTNVFYSSLPALGKFKIKLTAKYSVGWRKPSARALSSDSLIEQCFDTFLTLTRELDFEEELGSHLETV